MSFYIRKSLSVGPFRFNLSKSGIGLSTGIKGFRVGTGPRGNYVHMGRYGLYYRATLPSSRQVDSSPQRFRQTPSHPQSGAVSLAEIESGSVAGMVDSSSADLLKELTSKQKRVRLWPSACTLTILGTIALFFLEKPVGLLTTVGAIGFAATVAAGYYDKLTKTVVLFYELDDSISPSYQRLHDAFDHLASCRGKWHVEASGSISDWKRNAGAGYLERRRPIGLTKGQPPYVKTNIVVPVIPSGRQTLYFFPDRVLVFDSGNVGAISYDSLALNVWSNQFIESQSLPGDATVVGYTWQYVNRSGGPDRRFNNNRQIPIAMYVYIHMTSNSGLNELLSLSRTEVGSFFKAAVIAHAESLKEKPPASANLRIMADGKGRIITLPQSQITIGRSDDNTIQLSEDSVSHHHAVVEFFQGYYRIRDLDSTNGTFVNETKIAFHRLEDRDIIKIGSVQMSFEAGNS
jgi:hypothetical protein